MQSCWLDRNLDCHKCYRIASGIDCMHIIMAKTRTYTETGENSEEAGTIIYKNSICHRYHIVLIYKH